MRRSKLGDRHSKCPSTTQVKHFSARLACRLTNSDRHNPMSFQHFTKISKVKHFAKNIVVFDPNVSLPLQIAPFKTSHWILPPVGRCCVAATFNDQNLSRRAGIRKSHFQIRSSTSLPERSLQNGDFDQLARFLTRCQSLPTHRRLDLGDIDLLHFHHCLERALRHVTAFRYRFH